MSVTCTVEVKGHIIDSLTLAKILDIITESGATHDTSKVSIGKKKEEASSARINITAKNQEIMDGLLEKLKNHGITVVE